jgi:hypothetical protein
MTDEECEADQPSAPNPCPEHVEGMRSFSLNSAEAEATLCPPDPWVWAGGLPREPRLWERAVIVEARGRGKG